MPSLYSSTFTYTISSTSTPSLYSYATTSSVITGTVVSTNMGGLYNGSYAAQPNNAQALLNLLSNNGNVDFSLDPASGYNTIEANFTGTSVGGFTFNNGTINNTLNNNLNLVTNGHSLTLNANGNVSFPSYTFPNLTGNANQVLVNDGQGTLYWNTVTYSTATIDLFAGNGVQTTFNLSQNPIGQNYMEVIVSGILQTPGQTYTLQNANQVVFNPAPPVPASGVTNNIQIRYFSVLTAVMIQGPGGPQGRYGSFYDITTQTNAGSTVSNVISLGNTFSSNGISVNSSTRITFAYSGTYLTNLLGQFVTTGGGSNYQVTVWYSINGSTATNSSYVFTTAGVNNQVLANIETINTFYPGDYLQFYWWSSNQYMQLVPLAANTNPTRPLSPSVNLNVSQVTYTQQGPSGPTGPTGNIGQQGPIGNQGAQGYQGNQGTPSTISGPQGYQGFQGYQGPVGSQGIQGFQGNQGYQGNQGNQGFQGPVGVQGNQGNQGILGPSGPQGYQGTQGFQGSSNATWATLQGRVGCTGPTNVYVGQNAGFSGTTTSTTSAIGLGINAGQINQKTGGIALGGSAGYTNQHQYAIAIGYTAGRICQGQNSVAVGYEAAVNYQGAASSAFGANAGGNYQGACAVAIGVCAGNQYQGSGAVALGSDAGQAYQGANSIAIGKSAGSNGCSSGINTGTIIINATGAVLIGTYTNALYIKSIRHPGSSVPSGFYPMYYNPTTGEIVVVY
jgi:hypothetical protein